jgi:hypothetical protein
MRINLFDGINKIYSGLQRWDAEQTRDEYAVDALKKARSVDVILPSWATQHGRDLTHVIEELGRDGAIVGDYANPQNWAPNPWREDTTPRYFYLKNKNGDNYVHNGTTSWNPTGYMRWRYDMGAPGFALWFAEQLTRAYNAGIRAFWLDECGWKDEVRYVKYWDGSRFVMNKPINPRTGDYYTMPEVIAERIRFAQIVRENTPADLQLIPNLGGWLGEREAELVDIYGAGLVEGNGFFWSKNGAVSVEEWEWNLQTCQMITERGTLAVMGKPLRDPEGIDPRQREDFVFHSFLLAAENDDMFRYDYGESTRDFRADAAAMGAPLRSARREEKWWVRDFAFGRVVVDPTTLTSGIEAGPRPDPVEPPPARDTKLELIGLRNTLNGIIESL